MTKIEDNFNGYLQIGDDGFVYNVNGHIVSLMPTEDDPAKRIEIVNNICAQKIELPEFIYGEDNDVDIAFFRNTKFVQQKWLNPKAVFATPLIVKSTSINSNILSEEWVKFHYITFYGGNINSLYNPHKAVEPNSHVVNNGVEEIKLRSKSEFTRSIECEICGEKAKFTFSVFNESTLDRKTGTGSYVLGELNSGICLTFENAQKINKIPEYYRIIRSLVAILTGKNNIRFKVQIGQKIKQNKYINTGICKFLTSYSNFSEIRWEKVINIFNIFDCIPNLISLIESKDADILLALLPVDNRDVHRVSITDIQNICTALEVVYDWRKSKLKKDKFIETLKEKIDDTIDEFVKSEKANAEGIDDRKDIYDKTTIKSAFKYLDYTLKEKILALYRENEETINEIIKRHSLPPINYETVHNFVKLRNDKTHSGVVKWGDRANIYYSLLAIIYLCLFKKAELDDETAKKAVRRFFGVN